MRKTAYWIFVFTILSAYSFTIFQRAYSTGSIIHAQVSEQFPDSTAIHYLELTPDHNRQIWNNILTNLNLKHQQQSQLCQITPELFQTLSTIPDAQQITQDQIQVIKTTPEQAAKFGLTQSQKANLHCKNADLFQSLIFHVTAHVS